MKKQPNTFKAIQRTKIHFVRVPDHLKITGPRATGAAAGGREAMTSLNRGGFIHGGLKLATSVDKGLPSLYLPIRDVKVHSAEWDNDGGFGWTSVPLFRGVDFAPVNPVVEVRINKRDYLRLVKFGLADSVPNDDVAHNLVRLDLSRLPLFSPDEPDAHYVALKMKHIQAKREIEWARKHLAAARAALIKKYGGKNAVMRMIGFVGALSLGYRIKVIAAEGETVDAIAQITTPQKRGTTRVDISYTSFAFSVEPAPPLKKMDESFRFRVGNKPFEYHLDGILALARAKEALEDRYTDLSIRLAEREYGILYSRGDRTQWDVKMPDGSGAQVKLVLAQKIEARYVLPTEAETYKAKQLQ